MTEPLIFFVHIGKTAGSTLNSYLRELGAGYDHCEAFVDNATLLKERAEAATWMSGHVTLPDLREKFKGINREVRYYTCVREPASQIMSHYNWLAEIYYKDKSFYEDHPDLIKAISRRIRNTLEDPSPQKIIDDLRNFGGLFLNHQSKYFIGNDLQRFDSSIDDSISAFSAICTSDSLLHLVEDLTGTRSPEKHRRSENASNYHFDRQLFHSDLVARFLKDHNNYDNTLFSCLRSRMIDGIWRNPVYYD